MNWKYTALILLAVRQVYSMVLHAVSYRSTSNPTPVNVADVYDNGTYLNWKKYRADKHRLGFFSATTSFGVFLLLLCFNVHGAFASLFPGNVYVQLFAVILLQCVTDAAVGLGFEYADNMIIEQKYGFNRTSLKTFCLDRVRNLLIELLLSLFLMSAVCLFHRAMGDWVILLFTAVMFCLSMAISFLYPILSRVGNKFTPLEDGELKVRLMELLTKHGYHVKAIEVMDASRRTTKLNAYFTGFGKLKTIVLYDNLLNAMSADEICAVFAHELGHGLHKDVLKMQIMNIGNMLLMGVVVWLAVREPEMHTVFGFDTVNYGFAYILMNIGLGVIQPLTALCINAYSRAAEYRADWQAVMEGYGPALITGLKKLARENYEHLAPSPALVVLEYSHPPLSQRISAIEKNISE